jgi:predicted Rossmann fold nucleotide-binding protein DprA/Smf involved in DNA uptake
MNTHNKENKMFDEKDREQRVAEVTGALRFMEKRLGRNPSVEDIAEQSNLAVATTLKYLKEATEQGLIIKRDGKYMSLEVARAYVGERGKKE